MGVARLDHVVLVVEDLPGASADFETLGFTVTPGGEHKDLGTRNALVGFSDGSYLELIAFGEAQRVAGSPEATADHPAFNRVDVWRRRGPGLVDFALLPTNITRDIALAGERGLALCEPLPGARVRPDGLQVSWQFGFPDAFDLPFLCADVTPRSRRVPEGSAAEHRNGSRGISGVTVAVKDLVKSTARYAALLGFAAEESSRVVDSTVSAAEFALGDTCLTLTAPEARRGPLEDRLRVRGQGPCALQLRGGGSAVLPPEYTQGARIELTSA
jgi:catechol 2,3-dioxygenase-like lactoylglutathione lyase family enzyme